MTPTVSLEMVGVIVHVFGPVAVDGLGLIVPPFAGRQFKDHPPKVPVPVG
jgi:hypothetical protein